MNKYKVPVVMYHSVGRINEKWIWNFLTLPYKIFEEQLYFINKYNFKTISLQELYEHMIGENVIEQKSVVITFDDGYLDNWVYAFPLLKKYNCKGTIFVSPEFVDPTSEIRKNLEDVWNGDTKEKSLENQGFLSWNEMKIMEASGHIDIQSHGMSHTWYFYKNEIIDYRHPGDQYIWMDWNSNLKYKYKYMNDDWEIEKRYGEPIYRYQKSLAGRKINSDDYLGDYLVEYVQNTGGKHFFLKKDWRNQLDQKVNEFKNHKKLTVRQESNEEYIDRLNYELIDSKNIIEAKLNKKIDFFCWPGGGICDDAVKIAKENYKSVTLPASLNERKFNMPGEDSFYIKRFGVPIYKYNDRIFYHGGRYLIYFLKEYLDINLSRKIRQILKLIFIIKILFSSKRH